MKKYYTVNMLLKNKPTDFEEYYISGRYVVESEKELDDIVKKLAISDGKIVNDFDVHCEESTLQEFIKIEEDTLKTKISKDYLERNKEKFKYLPAKQYLDILRHLDDELYYDILLEENKLSRIDRIIRKAVDISKISLEEFDKLKLSLFNVKDNQEFDELLKKQPLK